MVCDFCFIFDRFQYAIWSILSNVIWIRCDAIRLAAGIIFEVEVSVVTGLGC